MGVEYGLELLVVGEMRVRNVLLGGACAALEGLVLEVDVLPKGVDVEEIGGIGEPEKSADITRIGEAVEQECERGAAGLHGLPVRLKGVAFVVVSQLAIGGHTKGRLSGRAKLRIGVGIFAGRQGDIEGAASGGMGRFALGVSDPNMALVVLYDALDCR